MYSSPCTKSTYICQSEPINQVNKSGLLPTVFSCGQLLQPGERFSKRVVEKDELSSRLKKLNRAFFVGILALFIMFKKAERLSRVEFEKFFKAGKRKNFSHLTIIYSNYPTLHVSVVVGKKVSKQAVRRNTIRRRVYARLRTELKREKSVGVYIIIIKPTFNSLTRTAADEYVAESIAQVNKGA